MWCIFSCQSVHSAAVQACSSVLDGTVGVLDGWAHLRHTDSGWIRQKKKKVSIFLCKLSCFEPLRPKSGNVI